MNNFEKIKAMSIDDCNCCKMPEKYVIKNCPAILKTTLICDDFSGSRCTARPCKDITDCLMKQIVEKCKDMASDKDFYAYDFANEILQLLEIEEVDE